MFDTLGHYKLLDRIGTGGIGDVYRARDTKHGRTVAIKVLNAAVTADRDRRDRFVADARAAAALSHPNIALVYEVGEDQGAVFVALEFVPGETLQSVMAGRPLNPRRAADFATQIADALADAHAEGVIHGDLRPDNIVVTPKGNAKILDFGLGAWTGGGTARGRTGRAAAGALPVAGANVVRTAQYLSPEQARGEEVDYRTDLFSLGTMLFEMLTGKPPFTASTPVTVAQQIAASAAPAPSTMTRGVPAEFDAIVGKAMERDIEQRYQSAATLAAELRSLVAILDVRSGTTEPATRSSSKPSRRPAFGWLAALAALAGIAGLVWFAARM